MVVRDAIYPGCVMRKSDLIALDALIRGVLPEKWLTLTMIKMVNEAWEIVRRCGLAWIM